MPYYGFATERFMDATGADMRDYISCRGRLVIVDMTEETKKKSNECDQSDGR